ncbi:MAG: RcpC/CpaB family pilus assembly protein [Microthrixaceae bacterium]
MRPNRSADSAQGAEAQTAQAQATSLLKRNLPSGRACVGAVLVTVAATGVLFAHRSATQPPTSRYLVATQLIRSGQIISAQDLGSIAVDLPAELKAIPASQADTLIGRVASTSIAASQLLRPEDALESGRFLDPTAIEVALELPPAQALQGLLQQGSLVDVLATDPEPDPNTGLATTVLATGVRVSAVGNPSSPDAGSQDANGEGASGIGAGGQLRIVLSVSGPETATVLVDAARRAEITLVLPRPLEQART